MATLQQGKPWAASPSTLGMDVLKMQILRVFTVKEVHRNLAELHTTGADLGAIALLAELLFTLVCAYSSGH